MKINTKILIGVGALALAYYMFKDKLKTTNKSKSSDANFSNLTSSSTFCPPNTTEKYVNGRCSCQDNNGVPKGSCRRRY
jgi:hypothetical protein